MPVRFAEEEHAADERGKAVAHGGHPGVALFFGGSEQGFEAAGGAPELFADEPGLDARNGIRDRVEAGFEVTEEGVVGTLASGGAGDIKGNHVFGTLPDAAQVTIADEAGVHPLLDVAVAAADVHRHA